MAQSWLLAHGSLFLEATRVGAKGRCTVPIAIRQSFDWFVPGGEVLLVLRPGGRLQLKAPFFAAEPRSRLEELQAQLDGPDVEQVADRFLLYADRYQRLRIDKTTSRLEFPDHIAAHLGVIDGGVIFAVRFPDHIQLWSERFREGKLAEAEAAGLEP